MYNIIFKTLPPTGQGFGCGSSGFGLCSFTEACPEPVKLTDVNGTLAITDGKNKLILNIMNDVVSIPILIDDDIIGRTNITIQEVKEPSGFGSNFGTSGSFSSTGLVNPTPSKIKEPTKRFYQLSIGKLFKTKFYVINNEFHNMAREMNNQGQNMRDLNVIEMNISFKTESSLQLISKK